MSTRKYREGDLQYDQIALCTETTLAPLMAERKDNRHQALMFDVCMHSGFVECAQNYDWSISSHK